MTLEQFKEIEEREIEARKGCYDLAWRPGHILLLLYWGHYRTDVPMLLEEVKRLQDCLTKVFKNCPADVLAQNTFLLEENAFLKDHNENLQLSLDSLARIEKDNQRLRDAIEPLRFEADLILATGITSWGRLTNFVKEVSEKLRSVLVNK